MQTGFPLEHPFARATKIPRIFLQAQLLKHDLVDEFWLRIFPITLGPGKRLFAEGTLPFAFSLHEAKTSPSGVIVATFKRAGDVETGSF
jgi:dihydrofolate reductase